jgi:cold shock CspA family protein
LLTATNGAFSVLTSNSEEFDFSETGSGFGNDQSPTFGKLTFYNNTGAAVTITFYVSTSPIKTPDVNVASTVNVTTTLSSTLPSSSEIVPNQFLVTNASLAAPVALAALGTYATTIIIQAQKTVAHPDNGGTANTGKVFIGFSAVNGAQPIELNPGDTYRYSVGSGRKLDAGKIYLDVLTANDGVVVLAY